MASITATYLPDLGRVRVQLSDPVPNVRYGIERSTDGGATWVAVRGGSNLSTAGMTLVDDFEYTANVENLYRLVAPVFYDSFNREYPLTGALSVGDNAGSRASTPDNASISVAGDIDLRADITPDTWSPAAIQYIIAKYDTATDQRSYALILLTDGSLQLSISTDGIGFTGVSSTEPIDFTDIERLTVRATLDADDGSGGREVEFFTSTDGVNSLSWTQLGTTVVGPSTVVLFDGTADLTVSGRNDGTVNNFTGLVHAAQVRDGIGGTVVAYPNFIDEDAGTTSFTDSPGNIWTVNSPAGIIEIFNSSGTDWGTADTGEAWNLGDSSAGFNVYVDNGVGVLESSAPSGRIVELLTDSVPGTENAEATWSAIYPNSTLDISLEWGLGLRSNGFDDLYESNLRFTPNASGAEVEIRIGKFVADVFTTLGVATVGTWQPGLAWNVRFRVDGSSLAVRAWEDGSAEPNDWQVFASDSDLTVGDQIHVRSFKSSGDPFTQYFGPISVQTIPENIDDTAAVTPEQSETFLKSITYPLFNQELECIDWQELSRESRNAFFDIKGRHTILGVSDVGSSATFSLTFLSRSAAQNRAIVALLTYGGVMLLQPPGDDDTIECPTGYSGIPDGYVMVSSSYSQRRTVYGQPLWQWEVEFTRVAAADTDAILPALITWAMLWDILGPDGTWTDVWNTWPTWQELWLTPGDPEAFEG